MSGRSLEEAITFSDDEEGPETFLEAELDVQVYGMFLSNLSHKTVLMFTPDLEETADEDEAITYDDNNDDADVSILEYAPPIFAHAPKEFELPSLSFGHGFIYPGSVVELEDLSGRTSNHLLSGDFLLIRSIIEDVETENIVLRGFRMRRVEYLQPLFNSKKCFDSARLSADQTAGKLNDLFMLIKVEEHDNRPRFVQGLETIGLDEIVRVRQCFFTHLDYERLGQSHVTMHVPARLTSKYEIRDWIFGHGKLICRWVHIVEHDRNGKSYGGEVRRMFKREVAEFSEKDQPLEARPNRSQPPPQNLLHKSRVQTMGDGFCGVGGASAGARLAGYHVLWGLEKDALAMEAYRKNFPDAMHLKMDAHDFPAMIMRSIHGCDHVHMSCPCCYWSEAQ